VVASCAKGREHVEFYGPSGSPSEVPTREYDPWTLGRVYGIYQRGGGGGTCVNFQKEMGQREVHYQGPDVSNEAVLMAGSQGVGKGERIFNLPLTNIPSNDAIPVGSSPKH
jgi:hypothetical protein